MSEFNTKTQGKTLDRIEVSVVLTPFEVDFLLEAFNALQIPGKYLEEAAGLKRKLAAIKE